MPNLNGIEFCRRVKENPATRLVPFILITGLADRANRIAGIEAGADDFLGKPFDSQELKARVRSLLRLKRYTDELDSAESVILSLALTVEARDPYTRGHCQRLAAYSVLIGERIGASDEQLSALHRGGYLHDVGKIGVPDAILFKPSGLTHDEYDVLKRHTVIGDRLCGDLRAQAHIPPGAYPAGGEAGQPPASTLRSICPMRLMPVSAIEMSSSLRISSIAVRTPASPPAPSP